VERRRRPLARSAGDREALCAHRLLGAGIVHAGAEPVARRAADRRRRAGARVAHPLRHDGGDARTPERDAASRGAYGAERLGLLLERRRAAHLPRR
jgi:hypothetical protein